MPATGLNAARDLIVSWLQGRNLQICWLWGSSGANKTALVRELLASTAGVRFLPLSAANPDRCLQQTFADQTTAGIFARLTEDGTPLVVLDALDMIQYQQEEYVGKIVDLRLRHLLSAAARNRWQGLQIIVTSRLPPPRDIPRQSLLEIKLRAPRPASSQQPTILNTRATPILETLAASRRATSGWLLGWLTGQTAKHPSLVTPVQIQEALKGALDDGLVQRVDLGDGCDWFQMPDEMRANSVSPSRLETLHATIADALTSEELSVYLELAGSDDPELQHELLERAIEHYLAIGNIAAAATCYWEKLGNFSRLRDENALHLGARVCWKLNDKNPPLQISAELQRFQGALAIVNDWGCHAVSVGDAALAEEAALAAYNLADKSLPPWDRSMLARHVADAMLLHGRLPQSMDRAREAKEHALFGIRKNEGVATQEVMSAYDEAFYGIMSVAAAGHDHQGTVHLMDEIVDVHARARDVLASLNPSLILPLPGPTGEVNPEDLYEGKPAALVALLNGRAGDAVRILSSRLSNWPPRQQETRLGLELRILLLRAQLADSQSQEALASIQALQKLAEQLDDSVARCQLAVIAAELALTEGDAESALRLAGDFLDLASNSELVLLRNDLLRVYSRAQDLLGNLETARALADEVQEAPSAGAIPPPKRRWPTAKVRPKTWQTRPRRREELHEAALGVIDDYNQHGIPFALYFRKYDFQISHGPGEFGMQLTENVLHDAMPPNTHILTVQDHDDTLTAYTGSGSPFDRSAPALLLENDNWKEVVASLIPFADLIVSECYMLAEGVRFELEVAYKTNRWDRTVLLLPPLKSPFAMLDNDPVIQLFPRCVWMDSLHIEPLIDLPVVKDLLSRMESIAALPEQERQLLTNPARRDAAFSINLLPIAEHYEFSAGSRSMFAERDDRSLYYGFWEFFRAASIRGVRISQGDNSTHNRQQFAHAYIQMSAIMLDYEQDGDTIILVGDLTLAEQCLRSAYSVVEKDEGPLADYLRKEAEKHYETLMAVQEAIRAHPERFILRPRYGPFLSRSVLRSKLNSEE